MDITKKIIIIDDDDRNIFALQAVLSSRGYQCITAESGKECLEKLQQNRDIGLALIDMMMPEMDGYQLIKQIRGQRDFMSFPLVAVTARAMPGDKEKCLEVGAKNYISKPINVDSLLQLIEKYLEEAKIKP